MNFVKIFPKDWLPRRPGKTTTNGSAGKYLFVVPQDVLTHLEQNLGWEELLVKLKADWNTGNIKKSETVGIVAEEIKAKYDNWLQ